YRTAQCDGVGLEIIRSVYKQNFAIRNYASVRQRYQACTSVGLQTDLRQSVHTTNFHPSSQTDQIIAGNGFVAVLEFIDSRMSEEPGHRDSRLKRRNKNTISVLQCPERIRGALGDDGI